MKKIRLKILALAVILAAGCQKKSDSIGNNNSLIGKWEISQTSGFSGVKDYPTGNNNILVFLDGENYKADSLISGFLTGKSNQSGKYDTRQADSATNYLGLNVNPGEFTHRIIWDNDSNARRMYYQINNNELILLAGNFINDSGTKIVFKLK